MYKTIMIDYEPIAKDIANTIRKVHCEWIHHHFYCCLLRIEQQNHDFSHWDERFLFKYLC